jgi:hypothetical protein
MNVDQAPRRPHLLARENVEVTLAGAGRSGSQIALVLAMLGFPLRIYDPDTLAPENLGKQLYRRADVARGRRKVEALRSLLRTLVPGCRVRVHPERFTAGPEQEWSPVVVVAVDTMRERRTLWEAARNDEGLRRWIDVRLGRGLVRLHEVNPARFEDVDAYVDSLHDDPAGGDAACGDDSTAHAAAAAAALVAGALSAFVDGRRRPRWFAVDLDRGVWTSAPVAP